MTFRIKTSASFALLLILVGCGDDSASDAGRADASRVDAPGFDASGIDANGSDASGTDAGPPPGCEAIECMDGYACQATDDGVGCIDIDECSAPGTCGAGEVCRNTDPGFQCDAVLPPVTGCGLDAPAFCEDFETPSPGGRGGDLDETRWAVSRWSHDTDDLFHRRLASSINIPPANEPLDPRNVVPTFCGESFDGIGIAGDMRFCEGISPEGGTSMQLHEVGDDTGDFFLNAMMVRQPFDFQDRTGTITFDVDAKVNYTGGGHGWWIELVVADQPIPIAYQNAPAIDPAPPNGITFEFTSSGASCRTMGNNILSNMVVFRDYEVTRNYRSNDQFPRVCFETADSRPNRFQIRLSRDAVEVWVSAASTPTELELIASVSDLDLGFETGYVFLHHVAYNARKDNAIPSQVYRWDNVGFDGPRLPALRAYDVPNNDGLDFGYEIATGESRSFTLEGVDPAGMTEARVNFNYFNHNRSSPSEVEYRVNDGEWARFRDYRPGEARIRAASGLVEMSSVRAGENTVEIRGAGGDRLSIANIDLSLR